MQTYFRAISLQKIAGKARQFFEGARQQQRSLAPAVIVLVSVLSACSTPKRSVYYQNDGPPDRVPGDLASIPDATPKIEPILARNSRPYVALGRSYTPLTGDVAFRERGFASWYGKQFHGNRTASGEIYDMFAMTAAHPTMPLPSYARVTSVRTRGSVIVRVNDRGPFKPDRAIDLSYAAASKLGIAASGIGEVEIERITHAQIASGEWRGGAAEIVDVAAPSAKTWSVQLGAFAQQANADAMAARVATLLGSADALVQSQRTARVERENGLFRVLIGALPDRSSAFELAQQLEHILEWPASLIVR